MREAIFFASFTTWALAWVAVLFSYGGASHASWRAQQGQWTRVPAEVLSLTTWFVVEFWRDVRHGFHPYPEEMPKRYTPGHMLRFFITLGAFVAGVMGFAGALIDRHTWTLMLVFVILLAVTLSTIAALGHLSVAWQSKPRRWRLFVLFLLAWYPAAMHARSLF